jgi:outer membrane protein assembly factor BamB/predicted negative regulator of RcsB-dependent stress response
MALRGNLESFSLPEIFQSLAVNQHTGTLRVTDGESEKLIYFSGGEINLLATGKNTTTKIGDFLIKTGKATPQQIQECLTEQDRTGKLLGEVLVGRQVITEDDVADAVRNKIEEEIYDLFLWKAADFEFLPGYCPHEMVDPLQKTSKLRINANSLIMESLRRMDEWGRIYKVIPDLNLVFAPANLNPAVIKRIDAPESHIREIYLVDGKRSISELVDLSMLNKFEFCRLMYECFKNGIVTTARKEDMVRLGEEATIKRDAEGVKKFFWNALYATPNDHLLRQRWAGHLRALKLDKEAFEQYRILGDMYLAEGNNSSAISYFQEALKHNPGDIETMRHLADALNREGRTNEAVDLWVQIADLEVKNENHGEAIKIYLVLIEHRPDELNFYIQLGESYLALSKNENALRYYELALAKSAEAGKQAIAQNIFLDALQKFKSVEGIERKLLLQVKGKVKVYLPNRWRRLAAFSSLAIVIIVALAIGADVTLAVLRYRKVIAAIPKYIEENKYDQALSELKSVPPWITPYVLTENVESKITELEEQQIRFIKEEKKRIKDLAAINLVLSKAGQLINEGLLKDAHELLVGLCRNEKYNRYQIVREVKLPFPFSTKPPGASVIVDGEGQGQTPLTLRLSPWLANNSDSVVVETKKHGFWDTSFKINPWTYADYSDIELVRKALWVYPPENSEYNAITAPPVISKGRLYLSGFRTDGNAVVASLEAVSGKLIWESALDTKGNSPGPVVPAQRQLLVSDGTNRIFHLDWGTGKVTAKTIKQDATAEITAGPLWLPQRESYALLGTNIEKVFVYGIYGSQQGTPVDLGSPVTGIYRLGTTRVGVSGENGVFRFFNTSLDVFSGAPVDLGSRVSGKPAVIGKIAYIPAESGVIHAMDLEKGDILWSYDNRHVSSDIVAVGNDLLFLDNTGVLHSMSYSTKINWSRKLSDGSPREIKGVSIAGLNVKDPANALILVSASEPLLVAFRPGDGYQMWSFQTHTPIIGPVRYHAGYIYFATTGGQVYAIVSE